MHETCNFDKKLNIVSTSEYIDYSLFSNLEKISINFSSKIAKMFNVALSGAKLTELIIEDTNDDYKMNYFDKNKFDFCFQKEKQQAQIALTNFHSSTPSSNKIQSNKFVIYNNNYISNINSKFKSESFNTKKTNSNFNLNNSNANNNYIANNDNKLNSNSKLDTKSKFDKAHKKEEDEFYKDKDKKTQLQIKNINCNIPLSSITKSKSLNITNSNSNSNSNSNNNSNFDILNQNINIHEKYNSFVVLRFLKFTNCFLNSRFKISHCSNLRELVFDDCLFLNLPFQCFSSIEKLTLKNCFQNLTLNEINFIAEKFKHLKHLVLDKITEGFLDIIKQSNIFSCLNTIELIRLYTDDYDNLFKIIVENNSFDKIVIYPDYTLCTDMLLIIKFLDYVLRFENKVKYIEFLVGVKFNSANIDRIKYFLRKLMRSLVKLRLIMPISEEKEWKIHFENFEAVEFEIFTDTKEKDILSYYLNE
jgi:hypothetical protein